MDHKTVPLSVKAAGPDDGLPEGQFEGYASVFGNVDSYGDIVVKGAFAKSLGDWAQKGDPIPLLWGHDFEDPFSNIGHLEKAEEDDHGLKVRGVFDLDNPKAAQVYRLAKGRRTTGMSFAYSTLDSEQKDGANLLKELHIFEASIVPIGANPEAGITTVKSAVEQIAHEVKAGRSISARNEAALREAAASIQNVLDSLDGGEASDQGKASEPVNAKTEASDEEPFGAKSSVDVEEPTRVSSVMRLAATAHLYALQGQ